MSTFSIARVAKVMTIAVAALAATAVDASDTLRVTFTGDVLLDRGVRHAIERHHGDASCLFSPSVDSVFARSQLVVANLECPVTTITSPALKNFVFRGEPEWLSVLSAHGITHLNLANNHSIDQGRNGLLDTRDNILKAGMVPIGAGRCMAEAAQPVLIATRPRKVYVVASLRLALENFAYLPDQPCVSQESFEQLEQRVRTSLGLPEDARIVIDAGFVSTNTNEYARLSVLAADGRVDAVIAGEEAFAELAGYGYFKDLSRYLPEDLKSACAGELRTFKYESDVIAEDAQQNGELASGEYAFGLSLSGSSIWNSMTADSAVKAENPVLGVILESENDVNIEGLIRALTKIEN